MITNAAIVTLIGAGGLIAVAYIAQRFQLLGAC